MASKKKQAVPATAPQISKQVVPAKSASSTKANDPDKKETKKTFLFNWKLALLLGIISFAVYANTLKNGYVLDDSSAIAENKIVQKGTSAISELLSTPYRYGFYVTENDLYRPLSLVVLAVEYQFFGLNPAPNHFFNILIFTCCVIALFFFIDRFFDYKKTGVAFLAALLFAVHPIHTEVVANIKSLDELLCFLFAFLSLMAFLKYMKSGETTLLLLGSVLYFLSYLSKETVVSFLAIYPLIFFFYQNESRKRAILISVASVVVTCIFLYIRFSVLHTYNADHLASTSVVDNALVSPALTFESRMATAVYILGFYLKLLLIPYPLSSDYSFNSIPFVHFSNILPLLSLAIYVFLAVFGTRRLFKNNKDPFAFCILFFLITIALFSNIPFLIGATMGERFMFYGSVGFCLAIALLIEKLAPGDALNDLALLKNVKVLAVIIPVSLIYMVITFNRNQDWESNYTLYKTDITRHPDAGKLNFMYGLEIEKTVAPLEKDPAKQREIRLNGLQYLRRAVEIDTDFAEGYSNVGNAYAYLGKMDSGIYYEELALKMFPAHSMTVNNLADLYYFTKQYPKAIALSLRGIKLTPDNVSPYTNLGRSYLAMGRADSAIYYTRQAIALNPDNGFSYVIMAHTFLVLNQPDSMRKYEAIAKKYNPDFKLQ